MKDKSLFKLLCEENGFVTVQACVYQTWKNYKTFSCLFSPKENDLLLYVHHCKISYLMKSGKRFSAKNGDVVFIPSGTEYTLTVDERDPEQGCTYGINFLLYNENFERVFLESPTVIDTAGLDSIFDLFRKMSRGYQTGLQSNAAMKTLFYEIISSLNRRNDLEVRKEFVVIEKGIFYLENDVSLSLSVSEIAKMCHVSQNYFCKLFKLYSGTTPGEYILNAKIEKGKLLLKETLSPISEIAELCGFSDVSYFCRLFKTKEGISPLTYRKK